MKRVLLGTVGLLAISLSSPVVAADMAARPYTKAPMMAPAPIYNWTGLYIGGHIGGAFDRYSSSFGPLVTGGNNSGGRFLGGVQVGADYQFASTWVLGVEAQYSWLGRNNNNGFVFPGGFTYFNDQRALGSVTGRLGYGWGPALVYAKGGYAYADTRDAVFLAGAPVAVAFDRSHRNGYTVGGGVEYMFMPSWSAKLEYMYYNFDRSSFTAPAALVAFGGFRDEVHTIKAGINYRFGWPGAIAARY